MAAAVSQALARREVLVVEAGTGIGKTFAYLVPALLSGRKIIVSTGTRNLQDQIYTKDIPFLRERAGFELSACVMKGRENYLCRYRMAEVEREPLLEDAAEAHWVGRIAAWSRETQTGDRAEIADLPDRLRLWRDVNARADTCAGSRCPEYDACWLTRMKRRAAESRIVVVNFLTQSRATSMRKRDNSIRIGWIASSLRTRMAEAPLPSVSIRTSSSVDLGSSGCDRRRRA